MAPENTLRHDVRLDALPSCLAAAKVQLHLLESAILKTEQELEASRAKACKSLCHSPVTPVQVVCIDEEWGSPWAATLAQTSTKLCGFREARHRLLNRMRELSLEDPRALADELLVQTSDVEEQLRCRATDTAVKILKDLLMQSLDDQAQLRSKNHTLESQKAELSKSEAVWQERGQQLEQLKEHLEAELQAERCERVAEQAALERVRCSQVELEKENAILKERCLQQELNVKRLEEQNDKMRGNLFWKDVTFCDRSLTAMRDERHPSEDDVSVASDLSSWVCIAKSQPSFFLADVTFKPVTGGRALQASELSKGCRLLAQDGQTVLEVLDDPEEAFTSEVLELWAGDVILQVVPDHSISVVEGIKKASELRAGDLVMVDGRPAALIRVDAKSMPQPVPAVKVTLSPEHVPAALFSRRLSEESPFSAAV